MLLRSISLALLCLSVSLSACGGGGGNGDDQDENLDPLELIEGNWKGTDLLSGSVVDITISPTGELTQLAFNGVPENVTGTFTHVTGRLYAITLFLVGSQPLEWRLLLDATGTYAAMAETDQSVQMFALEKGATTIPPRTLADYAPGQYEGQAARFDAAANLLQLAACDMDIDAGAEFNGQFGALSFFSPSGSPLDLRFANGSALEGDYDDSDATTGGDRFFVLTCPDGGAVAVLAFDTTAAVMLFFGVLTTQ